MIGWQTTKNILDKFSIDENYVYLLVDDYWIIVFYLISKNENEEHKNALQRINSRVLIAGTLNLLNGKQNENSKYLVGLYLNETNYYKTLRLAFDRYYFDQDTYIGEKFLYNIKTGALEEDVYFYGNGLVHMILYRPEYVLSQTFVKKFFYGRQHIIYLKDGSFAIYNYNDGTYYHSVRKTINIIKNTDKHWRHHHLLL